MHLVVQFSRNKLLSCIAFFRTATLISYHSRFSCASLFFLEVCSFRGCPLFFSTAKINISQCNSYGQQQNMEIELSKKEPLSLGEAVIVCSGLTHTLIDL